MPGFNGGVSEMPHNQSRVTKVRRIRDGLALFAVAARIREEGEYNKARRRRRESYRETGVNGDKLQCLLSRSEHPEQQGWDALVEQERRLTVRQGFK